MSKNDLTFQIDSKLSLFFALLKVAENYCFFLPAYTVIKKTKSAILKWENNFPRERWLMHCIVVGFWCRYKVESCLLTFSTFWTKALYIQVGVTCHQGLLDRCHLQQSFLEVVSGVSCVHDAQCTLLFRTLILHIPRNGWAWHLCDDNILKLIKCRIDMPQRKSSVPF